MTPMTVHPAYQAAQDRKHREVDRAALSMFAVALALVFGTVLGAAYNTLANGGPTVAQSCDIRVERLAKAMTAELGMSELKQQLADAALLCSKGRFKDADRMLGEVQRRYAQYKRTAKG